jgi:hypothetical protein
MPLQQSALDTHDAPSGRHVGPESGPQTPPLHSPLQHSWPAPQVKPSGQQIGTTSPHVPALHRPLQHWDDREQNDPFGKQTGRTLPHTPWLQVLLQHSCQLMQGTPSGEHALPPPQRPCWHTLLQHSENDSHEAPLGWHGGGASMSGGPQRPSVHWWLQQFA